ncbi:MAG: SPFH domain-containing protein [Planctomycetes bacterium]|nr:SPFH domain-containing protein [Planctomycetota bacterium]
MGLFLEVLEYPGEIADEIAHRIPERGSADIKMGAQLIVRDYQCAVFFSEGKGGDVLPAGRHTLSTLNLPILTNLLSLPWGFKSPFRCEVYFISLKTFTDQRWGTTDPVAFRDKEFGLVRLRAFGTYTFRVIEPLVFLNTLVAGDDSFRTSEIQEQLRSIVISRVNDFFGEHLESVLDLPKQYKEMSEAMQTQLADEFKKFGLELRQFFIQSVTPPEEVQKAIDERAAMGAVGDLNRFMKYKAARALEGAGTAGGGAAAAGLGLGAGMGVGAMLPGMIFGSASRGAVESPAAGTGFCPGCHNEMAADSRFCPHCGKQAVVAQRCLKCSTDLPPNAKFCVQCGAPIAAKVACAKCGADMPAGAKFCLKCGEKAADA